MNKLLKRIDTTLAFQVFLITRFGAWLVISFFLVKFLSVQRIIAQFEYSLFLLSLASFFWNIGLKNALINFYSKTSKPEESLLTVFYLLLIGGGIAATIMVIYASFGAVTYLYDHRLILFFLFLLFGVSTIPEFILLLRKKAEILTIYGILIHGLLVVLILGAILIKASYAALLSCYVLWLFIKVICALYFLKTITIKGNVFNDFKIFIKYALPFMFYIIISNGMEYVDGIIVKHYFPLDIFPVYRYGAKEFPFSLILFSALSTASIPLFIQKGFNSLTILKNKIKKLLLILFPVSGLLILLSPFLFELFYNELYVESAYIFNVHLLIIFSRAWLPQVILISKEYINQLIAISFLEIIINIISSVYLLNVLGLIGIAYGTLFAYLVHKTILIIYLYKKEKIKPSDYMPLKTYSICSVFLLLIFIISQFYTI